MSPRLPPKQNNPANIKIYANPDGNKSPIARCCWLTCWTLKTRSPKNICTARRRNSDLASPAHFQLGRRLRIRLNYLRLWKNDASAQPPAKPEKYNIYACRQFVQATLTIFDLYHKFNFLKQHFLSKLKHQIYFHVFDAFETFQNSWSESQPGLSTWHLSKGHPKQNNHLNTEIYLNLDNT